MQYVLMRKDDPITLIELSENGNIERYSKNFLNEELAPLQDKNSYDWISRWWRERSVPMKQGKIQEILQIRGFHTPEKYLVKNLGLSLTDYYWIKPVDSDLRWREVNLFDNNFRDDILSFGHENVDTPRSVYTPNSSLQGQLEKSWIILSDKRILVKGNHDRYSAESINEVIATKIHEMQQYDNYTKYNLLKIKDKEYDYGCYCEAFTNQQQELISAYGILTSEKLTNSNSSYEQFISICGKRGMDIEQLRADLEYQIMTDFILSNRDRHLGNISILRDADSLQFIRMAPIYDTGQSFFVNEMVATDDFDILNIQTNSFVKTELKLMSYIQNRSLVDVTRLPDKKYIMDMYGKDSQMDERRIRLIGESYERKIDFFREFQLGHSLDKIKLAVRKSARSIQTENIPSLEEMLRKAQIAAQKENEKSNRPKSKKYEQER